MGVGTILDARKIVLLAAGESKADALAAGKLKMVEYYEENAALPEANTAEEVGTAAAFLCSPLASGITGVSPSFSSVSK